LTSYGWSTGSIGGISSGVWSTMTRGAKFTNNGVFFYGQRIKPKQIRDGLNSTMFIGEIKQENKNMNYIHNTSVMWSVGNRLYTLRTTVTALNTPYPATFDGSAIVWQDTGWFGSHHNDGAHFAFGDGHVTFISDNIDLLTYQALSTRAQIVYSGTGGTYGGEVVQAP
jgi:prepilin-type processing-associated H-X9-DG protein